MPDYPDAHYNLANALLEQNRPGEAADHLRAARLLLPNSAGVHNNLGKALAEQGRLEEAATELRQAVALEPGSAKAHHNLGNVLASRGEVNEALTHLQRAFEIDPRDAKPDTTLAPCYCREGRSTTRCRCSAPSFVRGLITPKRTTTSASRSVRRDDCLKRSRSSNRPCT